MEQFTVNDLKRGNNMEWVDVSERLPEVDNDMAKVLAWDGYQVLRVNYFKYNDEDKGRFRINCVKCLSEITTITHWMPLPKPPES